MDDHGASSDRAGLDARWYRALRLEERIGSVHVPVSADSAASEDRWTRWCASLGADGAELLEGRAALAGVAPDRLRLLLGEPVESLKARIDAEHGGGPPAWLARIEQQLEPLAEPQHVLPTPPGLLALVAPAVARGVERVRDHVAERSLDIDLTAIEPGLLDALHLRLEVLLERSMAIEIQGARMLGLLAGDTGEQRFVSFCARLADPDVRRGVLLDYPMLARLAVSYVDQWVEGVIELLERLVADGDALGAAFGETGRVVSVEAAGSDPHKGGRHVWFVAFESGIRLVYKPRPFAAEVAFQRLVEQLNGDGIDPPLRVLAVVDRGTHGWMEFVAVAECTTQDEVERFHRRIGAWLAVLHAIGASDLHNENLLASGEHPVPVDHETILRARAFEWSTSQDADEALVEQLGETVLGTDLLPSPRWDPSLGRPIDHSGMGAAYDGIDEIAVEQMVAVGTDEMRLDVEHTAPRRLDNRARIGGRGVHAREHASTVDAALADTMRILRRSDDGIDELLRPFEGVPVRMVLRPTRAYMALLHDLQHPMILADALDGAVVEATLWRDLGGQPWRERFLPAELAQLAAGDVPYFSTCTGSRDIDCGDGTRLAGAVVADGLAAARERLQRIGTRRDLERHRWVVGAALAGGSGGRPLPGTRLEGDEPLALAASIAARLTELAVHDRSGEHAAWIGLDEFGDSSDGTYVYVPHAIGDDFYNGVPGVALFLAEYARLAGDRSARALAEAGIRTVLDRSPSPFAPIGAYSGFAGRITAFTRLGVLWERPDLLDLAERIALQVFEVVEHDRMLDIIGGSAGAIASLLALDEVRPASRARATAIRCGEHLQACVGDPDRGMGFERGFSHGPAGVVWAYALLRDRTGDERWRRAALELAAVERASFASGGYADDDRPGRAEMCAWCHGAAGVALGRLDTWRLLGDDDLLADAVGALEATIAAPSMPSHCLCHGQLGNLEALAMARDVLEEKQWEVAHDSMLAGIIADLHARGAWFANPANLEVPGLMTGLAGMGHALLRAGAPRGNVPSVLLPSSAGGAQRGPAAGRQPGGNDA